MIRCDKNECEIRGNTMDLMTEITIILKQLIKDSPRDFVMPMLLSAVYMCPEPGQKGPSAKEAVENFRQDTEATLKIIQRYEECPGETIDEKIKNAREGVDFGE